MTQGETALVFSGGGSLGAIQVGMLRALVAEGVQPDVILGASVGALKEPPNGAIAKALHAITLMITWQLIHDLERLPDSVDVHLDPALCLLEVSSFDFSAAHALIERAADETKKWIEQGGLTRRAQPRELVAHRH